VLEYEGKLHEEHFLFYKINNFPLFFIPMV